MSSSQQSAVQVNPRGIPRAPFIEKVEEFVGNGSAEATILKFQEMIAKYKTMESHLAQRRKGLESKIPEIRKTLEMVTYLLTRPDDAENPLVTEFEMNDTLWVNAKVSSTKSVYLWLGANVMLEYETSEAKDLLTEKLGTAKKTLGQVNEDLEFLKEQITTMEVNFSRVHNWDVKKRRDAKK